MAYFIPADLPSNQHEVSTEVTTAPRTPAVHQSASKARPIRVVSMGDGPHGKQVVCEFPDGWQRTLDLPTMADAWHPLFSALPPEDRQRLYQHVLPPVVVHQDGTRTRATVLGFVTEKVNRIGSYQSCNHFDVPAEIAGTGEATGYRCAAELLDALAREYGPRIWTRSIINDVVLATKESRDGSRYFAATAFLHVVAEALCFFAKHAKHQNWLAAKIQDAEAHGAANAAEKARKRVEFVERMREAKKRTHRGPPIAVPGTAAE